MAIKEVVVKNFKGIHYLSWSTLNTALNCLVGPGDSGKTSVLQAIELALTARWNPYVSDALFHNGDSTNPISIQVTLDDVPPPLLREQKFGNYLRGWIPGKGLSDNPDDGSMPAITIQFTLTDQLEPSWRVITASSPEGVSISAQDRALFGVLLVQGDLDEEFVWSKRSLISSLTEGDDKLGALLAEIRRTARQTFDSEKLPALSKAAQDIQKLAAQQGIVVENAYSPHLELATNRLGGSVTLHDGNVPVSALGMGSRRLLAIAMQRMTRVPARILLLDEIELGLEPFRLRPLLRKLNTDLVQQSIVTTHSPVSISELKHPSTFVLRKTPLATSILSVSDTLSRTFKKSPEAILARRIIVCEGKTEMGLILGLDETIGNGAERSLSYAGVALVDGNGKETLARAREFVDFGCDVCVFMDSDGRTEEVAEDEILAAQLAKLGAAVFRWAGNCCTEQRLFNDVSDTALTALLSTLVEEWSEVAIRKDITEIGKLKKDDLAPAVSGWSSAFSTRDEWRAVLGLAASKRGWIKRVDLGENVMKALSIDILLDEDAEFYRHLAKIEKWIYDR